VHNRRRGGSADRGQGGGEEGGTGSGELDAGKEATGSDFRELRAERGAGFGG
jgi:hypothetical protein